MNRRTILKLIVFGIASAGTAIVGFSAIVTALSPVLRPRPRERWQAIGPVEQIPIGQVTETAVEVPREDFARSLRSKSVYVWRPEAERIIVFSRNCTDLSCPVNHDPGSGWFFCPCHGGIFATDGTPMAGPPARPLYRYATRIRGGRLEIDLNSTPPMT